MQTPLSVPGFGRVVSPSSGESLADVPPERVLEGLQTGFVHLQGFGCTSVEELAAFTDRLPFRYFGHGMPGREARNADATIQHVGAEPYLDLGLHFERAYLPGSPDVGVFCMLREAPHDGYTTLCDGVRLLAGLSEATRAFLGAHRLRYRKRLTPEFWQAMLGAREPKVAGERLRLLHAREPDGTSLRFDFRDDDTLDVDFVSPCVHTPAFDATQRAFRTNILRALWDIRSELPRYFRGGIEHETVSFDDGERISEPLFFELWNRALACTLHHRWCEGDVVLVDNYRTMHGRYGRRAGDLVCRFGHVR